MNTIKGKLEDEVILACIALAGYSEQEDGLGRPDLYPDDIEESNGEALFTAIRIAIYVDRHPVLSKIKDVEEKLAALFELVDGKTFKIFNNEYEKQEPQKEPAKPKSPGKVIEFRGKK